MKTDEYRHRQNSIALSRLSSTELILHRDEFAVLVGGEVQAFYKSNREAILAAREKFPRLHYSICKVEPLPADVGFIDFA